MLRCQHLPSAAGELPFDAIMEIGSRAPAARAADIVLDTIRHRAGGVLAAREANG